MLLKECYFKKNPEFQNVQSVTLYQKKKGKPENNDLRTYSTENTYNFLKPDNY